MKEVERMYHHYEEIVENASINEAIGMMMMQSTTSSGGGFGRPAGGGGFEGFR